MHPFRLARRTGFGVSHDARLYVSTQVNPDQVAKAGTNPLEDPNCGEHAFASCLAGKFEELECEVILEDCTGGWVGAVEGFAPRSNLYVVLQSKKNPDAKWLAIDTHIDTVRDTTS